MKENNITRIKICPQCGKPYHDVPAISRMDNETLICPDCGTREALESIDVDQPHLPRCLLTSLAS